MEWITQFESHLEDMVTRLKAAGSRLLSLKCSVWEIVHRHPELEADALATFAALKSELGNRNVAGAFALVADVEKAIADAKAAYTSESEWLAAILASLKALAG